MLRLLSKVLGYVFLFGALAVLALELWEWGSGPGSLSFRPLGQLWYNLDAGSLNLTQAVIERYLLPFLWDPVLLTVLNWGAAPVLAVLAILFFWMGRR